LDTSDFFAVIQKRKHIRANVNHWYRGIAFTMKQFAHDNHLATAACERLTRVFLIGHWNLAYVDVALSIRTTCQTILVVRWEKWR
jgi:hypothetical protein